MAYTKTLFQNGRGPAISAEELNKFGQGIEDAHNAIENAHITGSFSDTSTVIPTQSSYTKRIPLGVNVKYGHLYITGKVGVGAFIRFTNSDAEKFGLSNNNTDGNVRIISGIDDIGAFNNASSSYISIRKCYVDNNELVIEFFNDYNVDTALYVTSAVWEVVS